MLAQPDREGNPCAKYVMTGGVAALFLILCTLYPEVMGGSLLRLPGVGPESQLASERRITRHLKGRSLTLLNDSVLRLSMIPLV